MSGQGDTKEEQPSTSAHLENGPRSDNGQDASAEERALVRKIDMRLVPCVWIMYLMSYVSASMLGCILLVSQICTDWRSLQLDRSNIGNAYTVSVHRPKRTYKEQDLILVIMVVV